MIEGNPQELCFGLTSYNRKKQNLICKQQMIMAIYKDIVEQYASKMGMQLVYYIKTEKDVEVYFLHDKSLEGRKTGWPTFVRIGKDKKVMPVNEIPEINRYIAYCNGKKD